MKSSVLSLLVLFVSNPVFAARSAKVDELTGTYTCRTGGFGQQEKIRIRADSVDIEFVKENGTVFSLNREEFQKGLNLFPLEAGGAQGLEESQGNIVFWYELYKDRVEDQYKLTRFGLEKNSREKIRCSTVMSYQK